MVSWEGFKALIPVHLQQDQVAIKIGFLHVTLRRNNMECCGITDDTENVGDALPEEQVAKNLPDAAKKRMMIYRDRNDKTIFLLGLFPKNKGKNLLLVLEHPEAKQTLHAIIDLNTRGERETKLEEMLKTLQSGEVPEEAPD